MTYFLPRLSAYVAALCLALVCCALVVGKIMPSSGQLVYMALDEQRNMRLWGFDLQHSIVTSIADSVHAGYRIFPSIDGQQLALFRVINAEIGLYIVNVDGSNLRQVPVNIDSDFTVTWLTDNNEIIVSTAFGDRQRINVFNTDESTPLLPDTIICNEPFFSPDGRRFVAQELLPLETTFVTCLRRGMLIADVDGVGNMLELGIDESILAVNWSPDSTQLALLSSRGGLLIANDSPTPTITQLIRSSGTLNSPPMWSPDSTQIAMIVGGTFDLSIIPAHADSVATTFPSPQTVETFPTWSPDGTEIAFASSRRNFADIYILNIASGEIRRVTHNSVNEVNIVWLP